MTRLMVAKFEGKCADCRGIIAKGASINYGGRNAVTHEDCTPFAATRYGVRRGYEATGSRCIDAPCCGCC